MANSAWTDYEELEEEFRHIISESQTLKGQDPLLILENYLNEPGPRTEYGVVSLINADKNSFVLHDKILVNNGTEIVHAYCQQVVLTFSVEFMGKRARTRALQLSVWLETVESKQRLAKSGFLMQRVSGIRALHDLIPGGNQWERRAQLDIDIQTLIEQDPAFRVKSNVITSACVDVAIGDQSNQEIEATIEQ